MPSTFDHGLFVVSAPSGAGKSSLVHALRKAHHDMQLSISHTTRLPRGQEQNGKEYFFVNDSTFDDMQKQGAFVEWAEVHQHRYGTSYQAIKKAAQLGPVVLEIDWQGALQIQKTFKEAILIFILPPDWPTLKARLEGRNEDAPQVIETRLHNARLEITQAKYFDYVIINDLFERALADLQAIVQAQSLRYETQSLRHRDAFASLGVFS